MNVPMRLRRLETSAPATGLLMHGCKAETIVEAIARLGSPTPEIHPLADGFLLRRAAPLSPHPAGAIRLRELAPNLFVPVDAELIPTLLDDEARAIARDRGLIFLPDGTVLGYDPLARITLADLVRVGPVRRDEWKPMPEGSRLAERIRVILDERPRPTPEMILTEGAGDIGSEGPPRPETPSVGRSLLGNTQAGIGRFLTWLGGLVGSRSLVERGARWMQDGMRNDPRLSADLLGRQDAALRELLRQFREGDRDAALRRALPLGGHSRRGSSEAGDANLPRHWLGFSLSDLLGGTGNRSGGRVWYTSDEIHTQLVNEYRLAANAAAEAGDFVRAAFIHGKLLGDLRTAAIFLERGQRFDEAAILYLEGCADERAAARCFEAAGDNDRAIQLYRKNQQYVEAGDLLRRAGDEDSALIEYHQAGRSLIQSGGHTAAGDFFRDHVHRTDLAVDCYRQGWDERPAPGATHCLLRLLDHHADARDRDSLVSLARVASEVYATTGAEADAVKVYTALVRLAERHLEPAEREELRDCALMGLSRRLRLHAAVDQKAVTTVAELFGRSGVWSPDVVADADVALRGAIALPRPTVATAEHTIVPLGRTGVTAVSFHNGGSVLFVGFDNGDVIWFSTATGAVHQLLRQHTTTPIEGLASDAKGERLTVLVGATVEWYVVYGTEHFAYSWMNSRSIQTDEPLFLTAMASGPPPQVPTWTPTDGSSTSLDDVERLTTALVHTDTGALRFAHHRVGFIRDNQPPGEMLEFGGMVPPPGDRLVSVEVRTAPLESGMRLFATLGIDDEGRVWWVNLCHDGTRLTAGKPSRTKTGGYLTATSLDGGQVVGVLPDALVWLRRDGGNLVERGRFALPLEDAVAVWAPGDRREVIVVRRRGDLVRVPRLR